MISPTLLSINMYFYRRGGAETVFLEENRLFEELGWRVVPFAMHHRMNLESPWSEYFVDEIEFGEAYGLWEKLRRVPKVIYSMEAQTNLKRLIDRVKPSVAHAHNVYHHLSPSVFSVLKQAGIPTVLTLHDLKIACPSNKMMTHDGICERCKGGHIYNVAVHRCIKNSLALSALIFIETAVNRLLGSYERNIDRFVVPSKFYIEKFVEWGWPRERFLHIPNFVDVEGLRAKSEAGQGFVYFGRLGPEKGLATLVRAAALARQPLRIVGTGPEEAQLRALAEELGADVEFLGYQTGDALFDAVRKARATVLPSEWYENAPMSVKESYALGTPVIGARIGGIPELIRPGETGEVFESGNAEDLASVLGSFASKSEHEVMQMGTAGRRWVEESFTLTAYRDRVLSLFGDLGVRA